MQLLSVKNLARYQHYKHRNPPWIKLYRECWTDYTLRALTPAERLLFIGLSSLGMELQNAIPYDAKYLSSRLGFAITTSMIVHLISSNLILSNLEQQVASAPLAQCKQDASKTSSIALGTNWVETLRQSPTYQHINFDVELGKMDQWLHVNPHRKKTKRFVIGWLNRIEAPLESSRTGNGQTKPPPPPPKNDPIGRGQWGKTYGDPKAYGYD
jgi:hypothetical protein